MRTLASLRGRKVLLGIWIFVSQHKFTVVDLQKAFSVYVCAVGTGRFTGCEKLERIKKGRGVVGGRVFSKGWGNNSSTE
jgi:hypothetical protein